MYNNKMNTNQYWNPVEPEHYWDAIDLTKSISKTPSFESLTHEEQIQKRLDRMETAVKECNNIVDIHNNNVNNFNKRINEIINKSNNYMKEFYEESPNYSPDNMINTLIWLSYLNIEKKDILDGELDNYFS
jgi:hypothetical protein|tara:strand:+ start:54 stop:446 length:393 start_codon:yes stop_codon:yes gene_type:complete